ncbi:hypothetical protein TNCT_335111 [Trichonephila clavata]|uniref:Uncharacterized protein n=1 Tax=Trichonephila clavata TaxID=2740835 RepID=A0A8X6H301_TRICU|nr:hypothetical protein TNCT_335111 [Trichonephila clavata]
MAEGKALKEVDVKAAENLAPNTVYGNNSNLELEDEFKTTSGNDFSFPNYKENRPLKKTKKMKKITRLTTFYICPVCSIAFIDVEKKNVHQLQIPGETFTEITSITTTSRRRRRIKKRKASYVPPLCRPKSGFTRHFDVNVSNEEYNEPSSCLSSSTPNEEIMEEVRHMEVRGVPL